MQSDTTTTFILLNKDVEDIGLLRELYRLQSITKINDKRKFTLNYPYISRLIEILVKGQQEMEEPF